MRKPSDGTDVLNKFGRLTFSLWLIVSGQLASVFHYKTSCYCLLLSIKPHQVKMINLSKHNLFEQVTYEEGPRFHVSEKTLIVIKKRSEPAAQCVSQQSSANAAATWYPVFIADTFQHILLRGHTPSRHPCLFVTLLRILRLSVQRWRWNLLILVLTHRCVSPTFRHSDMEATSGAILWLGPGPAHAEANGKKKKSQLEYESNQHPLSSVGKNKEKVPVIKLFHYSAWYNPQVWLWPDLIETKQNGK